MTKEFIDYYSKNIDKGSKLLPGALDFLKWAKKKNISMAFNSTAVEWYDENLNKEQEISIKETGVSMIYTSIILFFGFSIFTASEFGGTQALGVLVSLTLFVAMLTNLILLPSLLLTFEKKIANKKMFKEPKIEIMPPKEEKIES